MVNDGSGTEMSACWGELRAFLVDLGRLNPDYPLSVLSRMYSLASAVGDVFFPEASDLVGKLIGGYVDSPQKRAGGEILEEYYGLLESEERRLLSEGGIKESEDPDVFAEVGRIEGASGEVSEVALVPRDLLPPLTRYVVLNRAQIPPLLTKAADAYRRRNMLIDTVVEVGFRLLWLMDARRAERWILDYLESHRGHLDPDVLRDLLRILCGEKDVCLELLEWIVRWCGDTRLLENWPNVVITGDRVLCNHGVRSWLSKHTPRNPSVAHLALLFKKGRCDDETLLHWVESALGRLADCILSIMSLDSGEGDLNREQFGIALHGELRRLANVYPLVMMVGNQLLALPDGAHQFALAVFGLAGDGLKRWEHQLELFSSRVIKRMFIMDLRVNKSPVETIKRLTFGDDAALRVAMSHLDLVSAHFDSMRQRDLVVEILVPFYASFRRGKFLAMEVTRRYRKLMRLVHEDFLNEVLTAEQMTDVREDGTVFDVSTLLGEARRFLNRYRDQKTTIERLLAARSEFEETTRQRRLAVIRHQLWGESKQPEEPGR